mmetsp:Transcript_49053/g.95891  ORF Transcript_49053/g.95891 Transcript_49053/m.95891 type:complete len:204 (-) Transcript_49053:376-987(-)
MAHSVKMISANMHCQPRCIVSTIKEHGVSCESHQLLEQFPVSKMKRNVKNFFSFLYYLQPRCIRENNVPVDVDIRTPMPNTANENTVEEKNGIGKARLYSQHLVHVGARSEGLERAGDGAGRDAVPGRHTVRTPSDAPDKSRRRPYSRALPTSMRTYVDRARRKRGYRTPRVYLLPNRQKGPWKMRPITACGKSVTSEGMSFT